MAKQQLKRAVSSVRGARGGVTERLLGTGLAAHKAGRLAEAETAYRRVLAVVPDHVDALHLLGLCLAGQQREVEAVGPLGRAAELKPQRSDLASDFGAALRAAGRAAEAEAAFNRAVDADPRHVTAVRNLVGVLLDTGRTDAAAAVLRRSLSAKPTDPEALLHLIDLVGGRGSRAEALELFRLAAGLMPRNVVLRNSIGLLLLGFGRAAEALAAFDEALSIDPKHANSHCNRGIALYRLGRVDEALAAYETAVACDPTCMPALNNIGSLHADRDDFRAAIDAYERAHAVDPEFVPTLFELVNQRRYGCQWDGLDEKQAKLDALLARQETRLPPFPTLFSGAPPAAQLRAAEIWARGLAIDPAEVLPPTWRRVAPGERIRVGYISGDFYQHATATLVVELFERHDRGAFEIYGYAYGPNDYGAMRRRLEAAFDHFVDVGSMSDVEAARRIRADGIDILVDLKGYSRGARPEILALRPAPVQVNYLTYPATMGADFIDYIVVDEIIAPPEHQPFFSERLVHLPGCYQPNDSRREIAPTCPSRRELGLPENGFVFCSFNNNYKITPEVFSIWMRLLHAVPGSVLWLLEGNAIARENLMREAAARGVDPARLVFAKRAALPDHLARHRHADLFLDTLPVNAHTTASDALWAGLPVLTCAGDSFVSRVAASLNYAVGLPQLVTTSLAEYEEVALALARDAELLGIVRDRLAANLKTSDLFDIAGYTSKLEAAYVHMHARRVAGLPPEAFAVQGAKPAETAAPAAASPAVATTDAPAPPVPPARESEPVDRPASPDAPALPAVLNLGCSDGSDPRAFNVDADPATAPDAVVDLAAVDIDADGLAVDTQRFGRVLLRPGRFDRIVAGQILGRVADLRRLMTNSLALLGDGGLMEIVVPYDLSLGAWQDPCCVRAFNEGSFVAYTEGYARLGWRTARFELAELRHLPTELGRSLLAAGRPLDEVVRTPRAIEAMRVVLRKVALASEAEPAPAAPREEVPPAPAGSRTAGAAVVDVEVGNAPARSASGPVAASPGTRHAFPGGWPAHRDSHCVWIVSPDDYLHHHAFDEVAETLSEAFSALGGFAPLVRRPQDWNGRTPIVFGANLLPPDAQLPAGSVLVNLEQVDRSSAWLNGGYLALLKRYPVLDYSARNREALIAAGAPRVDLLEIGYAPALTRITPRDEQDIDVLFYGSLNERRRRVLDALRARGLNVVHLFGVYGAERDAAIARAKLVLNLHFYDAAVFEIVRVSYLLANGVSVVSEGDPADPDLAPFSGGIAVAPYAALVERCVALVADPAARREIGRRGYEAFAARPQADILKDLMK